MTKKLLDPWLGNTKNNNRSSSLLYLLLHNLFTNITFKGVFTSMFSLVYGYFITNYTRIFTNITFTRFLTSMCPFMEWRLCVSTTCTFTNMTVYGFSLECALLWNVKREDIAVHSLLSDIKAGVCLTQLVHLVVQSLILSQCFLSFSNGEIASCCTLFNVLW